MIEKLLTTAEACKQLGVTRWTLNKWEEAGELESIRTKGGHRRYRLSDINRLMKVETASYDNPEVVCVYSRVSSHEQKAKGDLDRQKARLLEHCLKHKYNVEYIYAEVGSGMNDNRSKLKRLFHLVRSHLINRVLIEHRDRLTRFNFYFLEAFFSSHGVTIECLEDTLPKSYEAELVEDIISLMASMSAKIYGKRSASNRKKKSHLSVVNGGDESCS
jgi:excisionase family DNA binding protein